MVDIQEDKALVNAIRQTNLNVQVFDFADLTSFVTTLSSGRRVKLTGIKGSGIAQLKEPVVGWVNAANLAVISVVTPGSFEKGKSFRVNASNGLKAYFEPGASEEDGPANGSTVFLTNPGDSFLAPSSNPDINNVFVRVFYTGTGGKERVGYVSQGPEGSTLGGADSNLRAI